MGAKPKAIEQLQVRETIGLILDSVFVLDTSQVPLRKRGIGRATTALSTKTAFLTQHLHHVTKGFL